MSSLGTVVGTARLRVKAAIARRLGIVKMPEPSFSGSNKTATFAGGVGDMIVIGEGNCWN